MQINFYLLFAFCGLIYVQAYKIPNVKLEILSQGGFRVSIPDETGISKVFYTIKINEMCPAIMDNVTTARDGFWSTTHNKSQLSPLDRLTICMMVKHNSQDYKTTETIKIDKDLKFQSIKSNAVVNLSKEFESNTCEDIQKIKCIPSQTVLANADSAACEGDLLFYESFDDVRELNLERWSYDIRMSLDFPNEEFALFDNNKVNNFIESGVFNIVPTIQKDIRRGNIDLGKRCTALEDKSKACSRTASPRQKIYLPPVHSTVVHTKNSFTFKYGRVEVRAQLPRGDWILPFLMLQESAKYIEADDANQIRIAFARGNIQLKTTRNEEIGGSHVYGGIYHKPNVANVEDIRDKKSDKHWGDDFHTYELTWMPTKISLAVDGIPYGEIDKSVDVEHFIVLGVSVGGHKEFGEDVTKPWNNTYPSAVRAFFNNNTWKNSWTGSETLKVDYVKVFAVTNLSKEFESNTCEDIQKIKCIPSQTVLANADIGEACKGDLLFHESFDDVRELNSERWSYDIRMSLDFPNEEFALFDNNKVNNFIESGVFNIVPTIQKDIRQGNIDLGERCTALNDKSRACSRTALPSQRIFLPPVHSTVVHTNNSFTFKFGRVEVRAQLPRGDWILPFLMLQESTKYIEAEDASQIRIAFARGNIQLKTTRNEEIGGSHLYGGIYHKPNVANVEDIRVKKSDKHWGDDFHTYELTWMPTKISLAVDGIPYGEIDKSVDVEHFIVLGVSVGGHTEFGDDVAKPWHNTNPTAVRAFFNNDDWKNTWTGSETLKVDYVKVFAV